MSTDDKARPPRMYTSPIAKAKRAASIKIRLTWDELARISHEAEREGLTVSSFVRRLLMLRMGSGFIKRGGPSRSSSEDNGPPSSRRSA